MESTQDDEPAWVQDIRRRMYPDEDHNYEFIKKLGSGESCDAILVREENTFWTLKIFKEGKDYKKFRQNLNALVQIKGVPNVREIKSFNLQANSPYVILEYGQPAFEYFYREGFPDRVCKFYFNQLIDALEGMHAKGIYHRDLKPEKLLFDSKFNLMLSDFGIASLLTDKREQLTEKFSLQTQKTTEFLEQVAENLAQTEQLGLIRLTSTFNHENEFMAPEMNEKADYYSGAAVDLYAAGIILFVMRTGTAPFIRCVKQNPEFDLFHRKPEKFWELFCAMLGDDNYFSEDFKMLINWMLQYLPKNRPNLDQIKRHRYLKTDNMADLNEVGDYFRSIRDACYVSQKQQLSEQQVDIAELFQTFIEYQKVHKCRSRVLKKSEPCMTKWVGVKKKVKCKRAQSRMYNNPFGFGLNEFRVKGSQEDTYKMVSIVMETYKRPNDELTFDNNFETIELTTYSQLTHEKVQLEVGVYPLEFSDDTQEFFGADKHQNITVIEFYQINLPQNRSTGKNHTQEFMTVVKFIRKKIQKYIKELKFQWMKQRREYMQKMERGFQ